MIDFSCPACRQVLRCSEDSAGETAPCPRCAQPVRVPTRQATCLSVPAPVQIPPPTRKSQRSPSPRPVPAQEEDSFLGLPDFAPPIPAEKIRLPRNLPAEALALGELLGEFGLVPGLEWVGPLVMGTYPLVIGTAVYSGPNPPL
jgi:hypothetical protein